MDLLKTQKNQCAEFSAVTFSRENKKNVVRIRKRVKCELCGKSFLQWSREIRHCARCGNAITLGQ